MDNCSESHDPTCQAEVELEDNQAKTALGGVLISEDLKDTILIINASFFVPIVALFGMLSNAVNCVIFLKIGFKETINISFSCLAFSDFFSMLLMQAYVFFLNPFVIQSGVLSPAHQEYFFEIIGPIQDCFQKISSMITAYVALERCICVTMPLRVRTLLTHGRTVCVMGFIYVSTVMFTAPIFFILWLEWHVNPALNTTVLIVGWADNWPQTYHVNYIFHNASGLASYVVVTVSTVVLVRTLRKKQEWRKAATKAAPVTSSNPGDSTASTAEKRDRNVAVTVTFISAASVILTAPQLCLFFGPLIDSRFEYAELYENLYSSMDSFIMLFTTMNSSINVFIYYKMSSRFRSVSNSLLRGSVKAKK